MMSDKKKATPKKLKEELAKKLERKIDDELGQTFPASDPPSHSRPGRERDEGGKG
jgi:hypothetical protein